MKKTIWTTLIAVTLAFTTSAFADHSQLMKDFAKFDRAFIPPLAITNQEKVAPSKKAMTILKESWKEFNAKYYDYSIDDSQWKKEFDSAETAIVEADAIVTSGKGLKTSHEILERIRVGFMELRIRNNMTYYIDHLTEFHVYMEHIYHSADVADPTKIDDSDIDDLSHYLTEAMKVWDKITTAEFDNTIFKMNEKKLADKSMYMKKESAALNNIKLALESKDGEKIVKTSRAIKPAYAKFYTLFGDFSFMKKS